MGVIKLRTSHLDLGVPFSRHPAPDILRLLFCSCGGNRGWSPTFALARWQQKTDSRELQVVRASLGMPEFELGRSIDG